MAPAADCPALRIQQATLLYANLHAERPFSRGSGRPVKVERDRDRVADLARVALTSATAGHAATTAPTGPCTRPCATLAASVAATPRPSSHRASAGTGVLRRAESSITIELA